MWINDLGYGRKGRIVDIVQYKCLADAAVWNYRSDNSIILSPSGFSLILERRLLINK